MRKILTDIRARQGGMGRPVMIVLIASFVLIGIYLAGLLLWSGANTPQSPSQAASEAANAPASSSNSAHVPPANPAYPVPAEPRTTGSNPQKQP